jgi:hypothetical protein
MAAPTKFISGILAAAAAFGLAGCALRAKSSATAAAPKPAAPAPAPANVPLSTPQTRVDLPKPQPIDPAALDTEMVPPPPVEAPVATRPPSPPPRRTVRAEAPTPAVTAAPPEPRAEFQEIISQADLKRLQESAQNRRKEVDRILAEANKHHPNKAKSNLIGQIKTFLSQSEEFEKKNDMRMADLLAEKAQILAKDLQNAR